jgi:hypothetical protein
MGDSADAFHDQQPGETSSWPAEAEGTTKETVPAAAEGDGGVPEADTVKSDFGDAFNDHEAGETAHAPSVRVGGDE